MFSSVDTRTMMMETVKNFPTEGIREGHSSAMTSASDMPTNSPMAPSRYSSISLCASSSPVEARLPSSSIFSTSSPISLAAPVPMVATLPMNTY